MPGCRPPPQTQCVCVCACCARVCHEDHARKCLNIVLFRRTIFNFGLSPGEFWALSTQHSAEANLLFMFQSSALSSQPSHAPSPPRAPRRRVRTGFQFKHGHFDPPRIPRCDQPHETDQQLRSGAPASPTLRTRVKKQSDSSSDYMAHTT